MAHSPRNRSVDKKTAVKLINSYAESYKIKEEENQKLKQKILDLKDNLKANKEMIENVTSSLSKDEKVNLFIKQQKNQIDNLSNQNDILNKYLIDAKNQLIFSEKVAIDNINKEREELAKARNAIFTLENDNIRKDNEIEGLKKKLERFKNAEDYFYGIKEIFIAEPTKALAEINDELVVYKNVYSNLSYQYKHLQMSISEYENTIQELKYENSNIQKELRDKEKLLILKTKNSNKESIQHKRLNSQVNQRIEDLEYRISEAAVRANTNEDYNPSLNNYGCRIKLNSKFKSKNIDNSKEDSDESYKNKHLKQNYINNKSITPIRQNNEYDDLKLYDDKVDKLDTSEWREVIRIVGFSEEEYNELFCQNSTNSHTGKFREAVDVMNTILIDRNKQINLLNLENHKLNNENIVLFDEITIYKKQVSILEDKKTQFIKEIESIKEESKQKVKEQSNCLYCSAKDKKSRNFSSTYNNLANNVINTAGNDISFNSVGTGSNMNNRNGSMITIKKLNINSLNQINNLTSSVKKSSLPTQKSTVKGSNFKGYYKNITLDKSSSSSEYSKSRSHSISSNNTSINKKYQFTNHIKDKNTNYNIKANNQRFNTLSTEKMRVSKPVIENDIKSRLFSLHNRTNSINKSVEDPIRIIKTSNETSLRSEIEDKRIETEETHRNKSPTDNSVSTKIRNDSPLLTKIKNKNLHISIDSKDSTYCNHNTDNLKQSKKLSTVNEPLNNKTVTSTKSHSTFKNGLTNLNYKLKIPIKQTTKSQKLTLNKSDNNDFIKIIDQDTQQDNFFEISNEKVVIKEIKQINKKNEEEKLKSLKRIKSVLDEVILKNNKDMKQTKENSTREKNKDKVSTIEDIFIDDHEEPCLQVKDCKEFTFDSCTSAEFKKEISQQQNNNGCDIDNMSISLKEADNL